jgi:hypothetical protein
MNDLLALLPKNEVRRVIEYCMTDLAMDPDTAEAVLYDATKMVQALNALRRGRVVSQSDVRDTP